MGADGGSIPRRDELVKTRRAGTSDAAREQAEAQARARWTRCALTLEPLRAPVAVDRALGLMFNKDALIRALLARDLPPHLQHIRSLRRDTVDARLYTLCDGRAVPCAGALRGPVVCPLTLREAGSPRWPFVLVVPCGCVVSEAAYAELLARDPALARCPVCGCRDGFDRRAAVRLDRSDAEMAAARQALAEARRSRRRAAAAEGSACAAKRHRAAEERPAAAAAAAAAAASGGDSGDVAAKDLFVTEGASLDVYKSLFHSSQKEDQDKKGTRGTDLFLAQSGKGGVL